MAVIDGTVVNIALPSITRYYSTDLADTQWTITAYLITMTSLLLVFGQLSDYIGRARLFLLVSASLLQVRSPADFQQTCLP